MKIAFDIDGTLTNFEKFIIQNKMYIEKKYNLQLQNYNGYDIDEMFMLKENLLEKGFIEQEAIKKATSIVDDFWYKYYFKYCVMTPFRNGIRETINQLEKNGDSVFIISSRKKTCEKSFLGRMVKLSTILKFKINRIHYKNIVFLPSDEEKIEYIKQNNFDVLIDDKPFVIRSLSKYVRCICVSAGYNEELQNEVERVDSFANQKIYHAIKSCQKEENPKVSPIKMLSPSFTEKNYKLVRMMCSPIIKKIYKPIILNRENIATEKPLIYAPNHRKTLDPFFILMSSPDPIHWAALKRFFTGEDSIFNNNKNLLLRCLTALTFRGIGAIPVDRGGDNTETIKQVNDYLNKQCCVGIFPEGTTNKTPEKQELLKIKSGILHFARNNNAMIQPVSVFWIPQKENLKNRVIINYRSPFSMKNKSIQDGTQKWNESILDGLKESKEIIESKENKIKCKEFKIQKKVK